MIGPLAFVEELYRALETGDAQRVETVPTPDVVWHVGGGPFRGADLAGRETLRQHVGRLGPPSGHRSQVELRVTGTGREVAEADAYVIVLRAPEAGGLPTVCWDAFRLREPRAQKMWSVPVDEGGPDAFKGSESPPHLPEDCLGCYYLG